MTAIPRLIPSFVEFANFCTQVAKAASVLAEVRDENVDLALTPKDEVWRLGSKVLYRLRCETPRRVDTPLLVVYALVGRWTILDLQEDRSFLRNLSEAGLDVYVLDWGHPTRADRFDDLGDMVNLYLDSCVEAICDLHKTRAINLLGICQGGVLSLCYAALHPRRVRNLVTCVTPVDFHADRGAERVDHGFMNVWTRNLAPEDIDLIIDAMGNLPGEVGGTTFSLMTPYRTLAKYNLTLVEVGQDVAKMMNFLRTEKWLADRPDQPAEMARQWLKDLYQQNKLVRDELVLTGRRVDLKQVTMPVLNIFSETDHIIPAACSMGWRDRVGTGDYTELPVTGGHIGLFIGRSQAKLREQIASWLQNR